jgi:hypothetical protein
MTTPTTVLEHALAYAERGWAVFPLAAGTKVPRAGSHAYQDATRDPEKIREMFAGKPFLNLAIATGRVSGVFILDIDAKTGGPDTVMDWSESGLVLTETLLQRTGSGGRQYVYKLPEGITVPSNAGIIGDGIDLRGEGGYAAIPPSKRSDGGVYEWLTDLEPVDPPAWLIEKITVGRTTTPADGDPMGLTADDVRETTLAGHQGAALGQQNDVACHLIGCELVRGTPPEKIVADALEWGRRCRPPADPERLAGILERLLKKQIAKKDVAGQADDYVEAIVTMPQATITDEGWQPFPVDALPAVAAAYVNGLAKSMSADPALIALPMLASMAAAIGNSRAVSIHGDWQEPSILWTAVVCESGTQKTPAYLKGTAFIQELNSKLALVNKEDQERFERETRDHEAALMLWKQAVRSKEGTSEPPPIPPAPPITRATVTNDTTIECLATRLGENPRGLLLARDELSGWLSSFDRYSGGGSTSGDAAAWLSMFNACPLIVDRKTSGRLIVDRASMSITGGIQPGILARAIGDEHQENGLLPRFLLASPPRRLKKRPPKSTGSDITGPARIMIETLHGLPMIDGGPAQIPLDGAADDVWWTFHDEHAVRVHQAYGFTASLLSKIEAAAARLALVVHLGRAAGGERVSWEAVDATSMARGVTLAKWFAAEGLRVHGATVGKQVDGPADDLLRMIRDAGGVISDREIGQRRRRFRDAGERGRVIGRLVSARLVETFTQGHEGAGRPGLWVRIARETVASVHAIQKNADETELCECAPCVPSEKTKTGSPPTEDGETPAPENALPRAHSQNSESVAKDANVCTDPPASTAPGRVRRALR